MEPLEFDLLFRWFVGLGVDDPVWASIKSFRRKDGSDHDRSVQM
jgi:hypothetical protein